MMALHELRDAIQTPGRYLEVHEHINGLPAELSRREYLLCAQRIRDKVTGISFWVAGEESNWYVGVWTPRRFKIGDFQNLARFIDDMFTSPELHACCPPVDIPEVLKAKYRLTEVPV